MPEPLPDSSPAMFEAATRLRNEAPATERFLWEQLRDRRCLGFKFRRQQSFKPLVADFYCHEARLVLEIDGSSHDEPTRRERDQSDEVWLIEHGFTLLRITNAEVRSDLPGAIGRIEAALRATGATPAPRRQRNSRRE